MLEVGQSTVAMWETGNSSPRAEAIPKIAEVLQCSISELFEMNNSSDNNEEMK